MPTTIEIEESLTAPHVERAAARVDGRPYRDSCATVIVRPKAKDGA